MKLVEGRPHTDGKVLAPGCASKPDGESREEPEEHKRHMVYRETFVEIHIHLYQLLVLKN